MALQDIPRLLIVRSRAGAFGPASDIDQVVERLPPELLFHAGADVERLAGDIPVDLVPIESAIPRLRGTGASAKRHSARLSPGVSTLTRIRESRS